MTATTRLTPEQIALYSTDFYQFVLYMFRRYYGVNLIDAPHIRVICRCLERVIIGRTTRLIVNIPPRSGKTEIIVKMFLAWSMGNFPWSKFIHASYSHRLASSNTYTARAIMQHEAFYEIFPDTQLAGDSKAKDEFGTTDGGLVYATGAMGTITGYGAGSMQSGIFGGAIIVDDPHKVGEANSELMRQNVIDWFSETLESRKNSPDTPIIIVMQRLHEEDLTGWLLSGGNGEHWEHLKIPALNDDGESFFPEKFPLEMLQRIEKNNPYVYAGQYQQQPAPRTGGIINAHAIQIVDALPKSLKMVRGWDLAATKDAGDATAGVLIGECTEGIIYFCDVVHARESADGVEQMLVSTGRMDTNKVLQSIPQDPGQAGKAQASYLSRKLRGIRFKFSVESGDKLTRASGLIAQINAGNARMLKAPWNRDVINEFALIPRGKHDDILDAASRAYNEMGSTYSLDNI